jgi:HAD superfamily hydrolase (TIGR01490 family)
MPDKNRAAFFDLDKTLLPGSSLFLVARGLYDRDFYRIRDILRLSWEQLMFRVLGREVESGVNVAKKAALEFVEGRSQDEVLDMGKEIVEERIFPRMYDGIVRAMEHHQEKGDLTFLVTASPDEVAKVIAEGLNMTDGLGTKAKVDEEGYYTGELEGDLMHGEEKRKAVKELADDYNIDLSQSFAYSDSISDLPLLESVGHPQVVNPDSELNAIAHERGWPQYELRSKRLLVLIGLPASIVGVGLLGGGFALGYWLGKQERASDEPAFN